MRVKIDLDRSSEVVNCDEIVLTAKFLKLVNVSFDDLAGGIASEKNYKLCSVHSYSILED